MNNIYASFTDPDMAQKAAGALLDHGVKAEHISVLFPEGYAARTADGHDNAKKIEDTAEKGITTTTAGDAAAGAVKGGAIGLGVGTVAALASLLVPGVGLVLGGGALALALGGAAGTTVAGAVAGGATGFMKDQGVPDQQIESYSKVLGSGGALLTVTPGDEKIDDAEIESVIAKYNGTTSAYPAGGRVSAT